MHCLEIVVNLRAVFSTGFMIKYKPCVPKPSAAVVSYEAEHCTMASCPASVFSLFLPSLLFSVHLTSLVFMFINMSKSKKDANHCLLN